MLCPGRWAKIICRARALGAPSTYAPCCLSGLGAFLRRRNRAWKLLRGIFDAEAIIMLGMGFYLVAVLLLVEPSAPEPRVCRPLSAVETVQ